MYIDQINNKKFNFILYLPIPLAFLGIIVFNYFTTKDVNVDELLIQINNYL